MKYAHFQSRIGRQVLTYRNNYIGNFSPKIHPFTNSRLHVESQNSHPREEVASTPKTKAHIDTKTLLFLGLFPIF